MGDGRTVVISGELTTTVFSHLGRTTSVTSIAPTGRSFIIFQYFVPRRTMGAGTVAAGRHHTTEEARRRHGQECGPTVPPLRGADRLSIHELAEMSESLSAA